MPKVTVIVPNYNHSRFLEQRIDSVLAQTCQDFEVILMDDASSDDSLSIFDKYSSHPRVSAILRNESNSGIPFKQWNAGVARAQSEYIWLAESDDYADSRLLQTLVDLLDRHPRVGLAYCQSLAVDENGETLFSLKDWTDDLDNRRWAADFVSDGREECRRYVALKCTVPNASAVVFRRSTYLSVGNADEDFRLSGDWMLWAKLMLASDVAFSAQTLNFFRVHRNTVRQRSRRNAVALEEAMRIFRYIDEKVAVPFDVQDRACNQFLDRWLSELLRLRLDPRLNFEIYRRMRALDGRLHQRVARRALRSMRTRIARA
jgi:glycosyltransferase involved in cell wall biosynthesis